MRKIFVTGIGSGTGKTLIAAILTEALQADYWKPIQAGKLDNSDTQTVQRLISNKISVLHPEAYRLTQPLSPHAAAALDGIAIDIGKFDSSLPTTQNRNLIIEGTGGAMSPVNDSFAVVDLVQRLDAEAVVVSKHYPGSINHTLLTVEAIVRRGITFLGIIFNGGPNKGSIDFILNYSGAKLLGFVDNEKDINKEVVRRYAGAFRHIFD